MNLSKPGINLSRQGMNLTGKTQQPCYNTENLKIHMIQTKIHQQVFVQQLVYVNNKETNSLSLDPYERNLPMTGGHLSQMGDNVKSISSVDIVT